MKTLLAMRSNYILLFQRRRPVDMYPAASPESTSLTKTVDKGMSALCQINCRSVISLSTAGGPRQDGVGGWRVSCAPSAQRSRQGLAFLGWYALPCGVMLYKPELI